MQKTTNKTVNLSPEEEKFVFPAYCVVGTITLCAGIVAFMCMFK